mmetsp:Transcript_12151/g.25649  ORF Transcript_12151/g.25649 Transcript_12151/m.25649 type:complete len:88 (-) Transcript_12151:43-306(-)
MEFSSSNKSSQTLLHAIEKKLGNCLQLRYSDTKGLRREDVVDFKIKYQKSHSVPSSRHCLQPPEQPPSSLSLLSCTALSHLLPSSPK